MDKISVKGLEVTACHGLLDFERVTPQPFVIDLDMEGLFAASHTDDIADTADYGEAADIARRIAGGSSFFLIERLAGEIGRALIERFSLISSVTVTVHKPKAPVSGVFSDISVSIKSSR